MIMKKNMALVMATMMAAASPYRMRWFRYRIHYRS